LIRGQPTANGRATLKDSAGRPTANFSHYRFPVNPRDSVEGCGFWFERSQSSIVRVERGHQPAEGAIERNPCAIAESMTESSDPRAEQFPVEMSGDLAIAWGRLALRLSDEVEDHGDMVPGQPAPGFGFDRFTLDRPIDTIDEGGDLVPGSLPDVALSDPARSEG
jgi:hypothetical protein